MRALLRFLLLCLCLFLSGITFSSSSSISSASREMWTGTVTYSRGIHGTKTHSDDYYTARYEQHLDETATVNVTLEYTHSDDSEDYFEDKSLSGSYFFINLSPFEFNRIPPSPRIASVARVPSAFSGHTIPVG